MNRATVLVGLVVLAAVLLAATAGAQSIYTQQMRLGAAESVLIDCPPDALATYHYEPHLFGAPPDRSNLVVYCGPLDMIGPIYTGGEPHWYLQPASPLASTAQGAQRQTYLPFVGETNR